MFANTFTTMTSTAALPMTVSAVIYFGQKLIGYLTGLWLKLYLKWEKKSYFEIILCCKGLCDHIQ